MRSFPRDSRIDFIRGIAVVSMVIQHVGGLSFLSFAFGAGAFYVSAAEVFVFLSGLVTARAALKTAARSGSRAAAVHLLKRAVRLYRRPCRIHLLTGRRAPRNLAWRSIYASAIEPFRTHALAHKAPRHCYRSVPRRARLCANDLPFL